MGLTGRARYARTLGMALRIVAELWWLRRTRWLRGHRQDAAASALYDRQARRFTVFATRMGGLIVKLGQFLSVRVDLLPGEYIAVLSKLQDALPAVPTRDIVTTIEDELHRPLASIFATFDETPIAAASLGQVHRATLPDGTPVAVKVLRPGIEDLVATDLASLRALLRLLDRAFGLGRILDVADLEADFTATFTDELDYLSEGRHAEEFQRDLLFNPHVDIPQIHWERTTRRVLTGEFMDGVRVDDLTRLDAAGVDRSALAANLAGVFFEMVLEHGRYHADPHPGNVFVRPDGVIQLIDFGMVGTVDPAARPRFAALVTGLVRRDAAGVVRALKDLGFLGPGADTAHLATLLGPRIDAIVGDVAHFYTSASVLDSMMSGQVHLSVGEDVLEDLREFIFTQPITLPGHTTFLAKALITVIGLCLRLDPDLDLLGAAAPYVVGPRQAAQAANDLVTRLIHDGPEALLGLVPRARHLLGTIKRLDDGELEADVAAMIDAKITEAERRQTKTIIKAIAVATGALAVVIFRGRR